VRRDQNKMEEVAVTPAQVFARLTFTKTMDASPGIV